MQSIEIKIEAFGAIERLLPKELTFEFTPDQMVNDVLTHIVMLHPEASKAILNASCTLVLLSPVAGG